MDDVHEIEDEDRLNESNNSHYGVEPLNHSDIQPKINTVVQYCLQDGSITKAKVISTQPKRKGKWKDWVNVLIIGEDEPSSVSWKDVLWWREEQKAEDVLVLTTRNEYDQEIVDAKENEFQNLMNNDVFELVDDKGQKTVSTRWVFHDKVEDDGRKWIKARLVARGFEERLADKRIDSPTCSRQGLRI